jgi:VWA domain-containing protein
MLASLVFLTPAAGLVAFAVLLPLAAFVLAERRVSEVRRLLSLAPPRGGFDVATTAALAAVVLLLSLAAAQPALARKKSQDVRSDAQALFVLDTSESMAASRGPSSPSRLERAKAAAARLRSAVPDVPSGVATLTDRVLPDLLPVSDAAAFDATLRRAVAIDSPPPRNLNPRATDFGALAAIADSGYFAPSAKHRAIVLLTDGETAPFDAGAVARALRGTKLISVRLWHPEEAIYLPSGRTDPNYRPDPSGRIQLANLAAAAHGRAVEESALGSAASALRSALGRGPTERIGRTQRTQPLAPYVALAALIPLALAFRGRGLTRAERGKGHAPERVPPPRRAS